MSLASLLVDLQVNNAQLRSGIDQSNSILKGFGSAVKAIGALAAVELGTKVAGAAWGAGKALTGLVMKGAEAIDHVGKIAASAQVSGEAFTKLDFAAGLSGVSTEELGQAFSHLNKSLTAASTGSREQQALFRALGVEVRDSSGKVRSSEAVFGDLSRRFNDLAPSAAKASLEMELFGKSGAKLEALFRSDVDELGRLAAQLGLVFTDEQIDQVSQFKDNTEILERAVDGVGMRVASELSPALAKLTDELLKSRAFADTLTQAVTALSVAVRIMVSTVLIAVEAFVAFQTAMRASALAMSLALSGNFEAAATVLKGTFDLVGDQIAELGGRLDTVWNGVAQTSGNVANKATKDAAKIAAAAKGAAAAKAQSDRDFELERKTGGMNRAAAQQRTAFGDIGKDAGALFARATAGFENFNAALEESTARAIQRETWLNEAAERRSRGDEEGARAALLFADKMGEASDKAKEAMDQFKDQAQQDAKKQAEEMKKAVSAIGAVGTQFASKLGELGDVINAGIQGGESGGIWGAMVAVVIELLSKFEGFSRIIDIANGTVQMALRDMGGGFKELVTGLRPLLGAISGIAKGVHSILGPIIALVGKLFQQIAATLGPVGIIIQQVGASLEPLFTILGGIMEILKIFQPVLAVVSLSMLGLKLAMQYVSLGFHMFLDWVLEKLGSNDNSGVESAQNAVNATQNEIVDLAKQLAKDPLNVMTNHANSAADELEQLGKKTEETNERKDDENKAIKETTEAMSKLTEQFTNLPDGFRVSALQYGAMGQVGSSMGTASGGLLGALTIIVQGSLVHENQLMDLVAKKGQKARFRKYGTTSGP